MPELTQVKTTYSQFLNCDFAAKPNPLTKAIQNSNNGKVTVAATSVVHQSSKLANKHQKAISL